MVDRTIAYMVLGAGILLSAVGAYMSIMGLSSIFGGAVVVVVAMGVVLELSKTTTAVYLKVLWGNQSVIIRSYFIIATVILSVVTSLGVFGFLSRSYSTDVISFDSNKFQVESIQRQIDLGHRQLKGLELQLEKYDVPPRRIQQKIDEVSKNIVELESKLLVEKQSSAKYGAEMKPLVFMSNLLFGTDNPEVAVKLLITLLVITMDPLALLLTTVGVSMLRKEIVYKSSDLVYNDIYEMKLEKVVDDEENEIQKRRAQTST